MRSVSSRGRCKASPSLPTDSVQSSIHAYQHFVAIPSAQEDISSRKSIVWEQSSARQCSPAWTDIGHWSREHEESCHGWVFRMLWFSGQPPEDSFPFLLAGSGCRIRHLRGWASQIDSCWSGGLGGLASCMLWISKKAAGSLQGVSTSQAEDHSGWRGFQAPGLDEHYQQLPPRRCISMSLAYSMANPSAPVMKSTLRFQDLLGWMWWRHGSWKSSTFWSWEEPAAWALGTLTHALPFHLKPNIQRMLPIIPRAALSVSVSAPFGSQELLQIPHLVRHLGTFLLVRRPLLNFHWWCPMWNPHNLLGCH